MCRCACVLLLFFFFQAEDGIRNLTVTGVQTCALPISASLSDDPVPEGPARGSEDAAGRAGSAGPRLQGAPRRRAAPADGREPRHPGATPGPAPPEQREPTACEGSAGEAAG